jgi:hypothetical protein
MAWLIEAGGQRSRDAALVASRSLSPITVAPELTGRGGVGPQVAVPEAFGLRPGQVQHPAGLLAVLNHLSTSGSRSVGRRTCGGRPAW